MLTKEDKKKQIDKFVKEIKSSYAIIVWNYHGLRAKDISLVKSKIAAVHGFDHVYKNRLAKIAFKNLNKNEILDYLKGSSSFLIIPNEESTALLELYKLIKQFTKGKKESLINLKAGYVDNVFYDTPGILEIAALPSKDVLLSMLLSALKGNMQNLAYDLSQVALQKN